MNWLINRWYWIKGPVLDFWLRHIAPWVSCVAVLSGSFLTYDFSKLQAHYPDWPGLFHLMDSGLLLWVFLVTAILTAVMTWLSAIRQKSLDSLTQQLRERQDAIDQISQNIKYVFDGLLLNLSKKLGFNRNDKTRLSIYIHDPERKSFVLCGRFATNPLHRQPGNRTSYPDSQGCIGKGWLDGWHFDNTFPADVDGHRDQCQKQYGIPNKTHNRMRMRSRLYATKRLEDSLSNAWGVLVIESLQEDRFEEATLKANLDDIADDFAELIRSLRPYIPNPNDATARGL